MKQETKYIYFETYEVIGSNPEPKRMQRENFLLRKPHTNSDGVWGYRHVTERKGFEVPTFVFVDQFWIDLEKYTIMENEFDERGSVKLLLYKLKKYENGRII
jgi:hypothetical protein